MKRYLVIFLMLASTNSFGAINKWVDSDGNVHYSDQTPPSEAKTRTLRSTPDTEGAAGSSELSATSAPAAPKTMAEKEAELKKKQKTKQEATDKTGKEQANAEAAKANCATAQESLRTLQSGIRMVEVGEDGKRSYMDNAQRQQRIEKTQGDINTYCK